MWLNVGEEIRIKTPPGACQLIQIFKCSYSRYHCCVVFNPKSVILVVDLVAHLTA